jgi:DNA-binding Xre family transcriptional regulator
VRLLQPVNLVFCMKDRDVSVRDLAARVQCAPSTISKLCTGMQVSTSERIANAIESELNTKPGALFAMSELCRVPREDAPRETVGAA